MCVGPEVALGGELLGDVFLGDWLGGEILGADLLGGELLGGELLGGELLGGELLGGEALGGELLGDELVYNLGEDAVQNAAADAFGEQAVPNWSGEFINDVAPAVEPPTYPMPAPTPPPAPMPLPPVPEVGAELLSYPMPAPTPPPAPMPPPPVPGLSLGDSITQAAKDIWGNPVGQLAVKSAAQTGLSTILGGEQQRTFNNQLAAVKQYQAGLQTPLGVNASTLAQSANANAGTGAGTGTSVGGAVDLADRPSVASLIGSRGAVNPAGTLAAMDVQAPRNPATPPAAPGTPQRVQNGAIKLPTRPLMYV